MFPNALFPPTLFTPQVFPRGYRLPVPHGDERLTWKGVTKTELVWEGTDDGQGMEWTGGIATGYTWEGTTVTGLRWQGGATNLLEWEGTDDRENALRWSGITDGKLSWVGELVEGVAMQEASDAARRRVPLLVEYTFQNPDGPIDLTPYATVKLLVKTEGVLYQQTAAQFVSPKTGGQVFYDGYAFLTAGRWYAQFLAETSGGVPLYGDEIGFDVKPNLDDLQPEERPE